MEPRECTIDEANAALLRREMSCEELVRSCLDQISAQNDEFNAFIALRSETAVLADARDSDMRRRSGTAGRLDGIPIALKANFAYEGLVTSAGSRILERWRPSTDARSVANLRRQGAVVLGMTNMHEFADGPTNDNPHYGRPLNPRDRALMSGGSSGGSAVAVATHMCLAATGSDDGGSIRVPAAFCGVVGLKPTFGLVDVSGIVPFSYSLDHAGPITRSASDAVTVLSGMAGTSLDPPERPSGTGVVGVIPQFERDLDPAIKRILDQRLRTLESCGFEIREVVVPSLEKAITALIIILFSEAAAIHHEFLKHRRDLYGADVRDSLQSGRFYSAVDYVNAKAVQQRFRSELDAAFSAVDFLLTPTTAVLPPAWGTTSVRGDTGEIDILDAIIRYTAPFDLSGHPAISVPAGNSEAGLPVGLQLVGPRHSEAFLAGVAAKHFEDPRHTALADASSTNASPGEQYRFGRRRRFRPDR